jgi:hypothetical protein
MVTPVRVDGGRFGFDGGKLCLTCYNRHAKREWRTRRRDVAPGAAPTPHRGL